MAALEPQLLEAQVLTMCDKYRYEEAHCRQVASLAKAIFEYLGPLHGLGPTELTLLRHGALLHDLGAYISHKGHHRHSAYLILHDTALQDYPEEHRAILALMALNHRKKPTRPDKALGPERARTALQLSAILRLADGLDYDRVGKAAIAGCEITPDEIRLTVSGIDLRNLTAVLKTKARLMKEAFGRKVRWTGLEKPELAAAGAKGESA